MPSKIAGVLSLFAASMMAAQTAALAADTAAADSGTRTHAAPVTLGLVTAPDVGARHTGTVMGVSVTVVASPNVQTEVRRPAPAKPPP